MTSSRSVFFSDLTFGNQQLICPQKCQRISIADYGPHKFECIMAIGGHREQPPTSRPFVITIQMISKQFFNPCDFYVMDYINYTRIYRTIYYSPVHKDLYICIQMQERALPNKTDIAVTAVHQFIQFIQTGSRYICNKFSHRSKRRN